MTDRPVGAFIEVIERRQQPTDPDSSGADLIAPNEIRINGQPLLSPATHPIRVQEVEIKAQSLVLVTLTLFAKRVVIAAEDPEEKSEEVASDE